MTGGFSRTRRRTSLCTSISVARWIFLRSYYSLNTFGLDFCGGTPDTARQHWSRVRHSSTALRSRKHPLGLCSLSPQSQAKVDQSNTEIEIVTWLFEQATLCVKKTIGILLIYRGGYEQDGPATIWSNTHLRKLDGASEVQRGAAFSRQIASTESSRPVGLFTNLTWVKSQMAPGWPRLYKVDRQLLHDGPLPGRCPCTAPHAPMKGTDRQEMFNSSISAGCSKQCRFSCTASSSVYEGHVPLRVGGPSHTFPSPSMSLSSCVSPSSFSGWSGSATTYGPVVRFLAVSSLTTLVPRPLQIFSVPGPMAIIRDSATSLTSARFSTLRSGLVGTWVWRGQLQLHSLVELRKGPW